MNYTTPYWPQANGEIERQNRSILKRLKISHALKRDWKDDLNNFLLAYRTIPHGVTGKTPSDLMFGRTIRSKIPALRDIEHEVPRLTEAQDKDRVLKEKGKEREDIRRKARYSDIEIGDKVLAKDFGPKNKLSTTFRDEDNTVINRQGNRVTIQNNESGKIFQRAVAHLKKIPTQFSPQHTSTPGPPQRTDRLNTAPETSKEASGSSEIPAKIKHQRPSRTIQRPVTLRDFV